MASDTPHWPAAGGGDIVIIPSHEPASPYPSLVSDLAAERTTVIRLKMAPLINVRTCVARLEKARSEKIWPNGKRHLWSDALGLVLLISLYKEVSTLEKDQ